MIQNVVFYIFKNISNKEVNAIAITKRKIGYKKKNRT